jgi:hypothetical protein
MPEPCNTCGASVRLVQRRVDGDLVDVRKCTNPQCSTNNGEASLADRV